MKNFPTPAFKYRLSIQKSQVSDAEVYFLSTIPISLPCDWAQPPTQAGLEIYLKRIKGVV